jgi:importin subunit alpha-6/7
VIPPLIYLLGNAEFDIKKEAAWAISNATSGGTAEQIKFLVHQGCIPPLCELLVAQDYKIVNVALEGLENILKVGEADAQQTGQPNMMAKAIDEADGLTKIEALQQHEAEAIYNKSVKILETYFGAEVEDESIAPATGPANQFTFGAGGGPAPPGGFNFGS